MFKNKQEVRMPGQPLLPDVEHALTSKGGSVAYEGILRLIAVVLDEGLKDGNTYLTLGHNRAGQHMVSIFGGDEPIRCSGVTLDDLNKEVWKVLESL